MYARVCVWGAGQAEAVQCREEEKLRQEISQLSSVNHNIISFPPKTFPRERGGIAEEGNRHIRTPNKLGSRGATAENVLLLSVSQNGEAAAWRPAAVSLTWAAILLLLPIGCVIVGKVTVHL